MSNKSKSKNEAPAEAPVVLERQFLPEQMPVQAKRKDLPNLLRFMQKKVQFLF
jgi:hypothetical protein